MRKGSISTLAMLAVTHAAVAQDLHELQEDSSIFIVQRNSAPGLAMPAPEHAWRELRGAAPLWQSIDAISLPAPLGVSPLFKRPPPRISMSVATAGGQPGLSFNYVVPMDRRSGFFAAIVTTGKQSVAKVSVGLRW
jgi:hypothetical protein